MVTFTIDSELVDRLKAWIAQQEPEPRQNAVISTAIKRFLDENEPNADNGPTAQ